LVAADEWAAAESAATGLPPVVLHPVAASATKTTASTTLVAERFAILGAYVG
jgi:hydroxyethylthiazole kinase-like sugar kinase family protein